MKRTHLPLNAMRVFDAAARHLSFTRAADELAVTPAAVGQQIRALEDLLGVVLFRRTPKGLELTEEAVAGLESLRTGFLHFEDAVQAMQAGQALSAAVAGMGRARVPALLAQGWRDLGRLDALEAPEACRRGYWLVAPLPQWRQKKVKALLAALTA